MLSILIEGLVFGLSLAVSLGPIFIALTQTSIEKGVWPGMTVGLGIWVSDFIILGLFYKFIYEIKDQIQGDTFRFWLGISGVLIMVGFGLYLIMRAPIVDYSKQKHTYKSYLGFWLKGFLINTINPFTIFFWLGVISTYIIGRDLPVKGHIVLFSTILAVIILSDSGKVLLADYLKSRLTAKHINTISNFSGAILVGFGIFLGYQVI